MWKFKFYTIETGFGGEKTFYNLNEAKDFLYKFIKEFDLTILNSVEDLCYIEDYYTEDMDMICALRVIVQGPTSKIYHYDIEECLLDFKKFLDILK